MKETKKVGRNIAFTILGQLVGIVIAFLYITFIPRNLGPERLGQFSYWISLCFILAAALDFGTSFYSRYISEFKIKAPGKVKAILIESLKVDGAIFLGLIFIIPTVLDISPLEMAAVFLGAILTTVLSIFAQVFYSYERLGYSSFIRNVMRCIRIALILLIVKSGVNLLWALFLPELITVFLYALPFKNILPDEKPSLPEGMKRYLSFGLYAYLGTVCFLVLGRSTVVLAKEMVGDLNLVGYTSIGVEISIYALRILAVSVFFAALPSGIRYMSNDDQNRFDRFLELSWRYGNIIIFPLCFGFVLFGYKAVELFIGKRYIPGVPIIFSFLPSSVLLFWLQAHHHLLVIYEKKEFLFYSSLISVLIFITIATGTVFKIGIYGLPLSLSIGLLAGYIYAYLRTSSFKKIRGYFSSILKPLGSGMVMSFVVYLLRMFSSMDMIYLVLLGAITYIISMIFFKGISKEDYLKIKAVLNP